MQLSLFTQVIFYYIAPLLIASNSSLSECVIHHIPLSNTLYYQTDTWDIVSADHHYFENSTSIVNNDTHMSPGHLELSLSTTFSSCEWKDCRSDDGCNGDAIFSNTERVKLSCDTCSFTDCFCASSNKNGGSIYAQSISEISVAYSLFQCTSLMNEQAPDGGAICLYTVPSVTFHDASFIQCYVHGCEADVYMNQCSTKSGTRKVVDCCKFFSCKGVDNAGGGTCADNDQQYNNFVSNSLFSECADKWASALWLSYYSSSV